MAVRRKNVAVDLFRGLLIAILLTLVAMLAAAALAMLARVSDSAIRALNQAIKLGAILFGVRAAVPRGGVHVFATGAAVAMAYMILGYGMYALLGGGAAQARRIVSGYKPQYPSISAYLAAIDRLFLEKDAVVYDEAGNARVDYQNEA